MNELTDLLQEQGDAFKSFAERTTASLAAEKKEREELELRMNRLGLGAGSGTQPISQTTEGKAFASFARKGMSVDSDPEGGYTVPAMVDGDIRKRLREIGVMRRLSRVVTIGAGSDFSVLVGNSDSTSGWVGEREDRPETDASTLNKITIPVYEMYALPMVTQKLLEDSGFDVAAYLSAELAGNFALKEEEAFVNGTGANQPRGFLQYDAPVTTADATRAFGTLQYVPSGVAADINDGSNNGVDALISLVYALRQPYRVAGEVAWLMNSTVAGKVRKLKTIGGSPSGDYLWMESVMAGQPPTLLGYPVWISESMPSVGSNAFPIAFGNFAEGYTVVDKTFGTSMLRDPYTSKPFVKFYTRRRVGGGLVNSEAIKLLKCATT